MILVRFGFANYFYNRRNLLVENGEVKSVMMFEYVRGALMVSVRGFRL